MPLHLKHLSRRTLLQQSAAGFGLLGLRALMASEASAPNPLANLIGELNARGTPATDVPRFDCDFRQVRKPFPHFWEHTVGSGHAPLALRADWQAQMLRCHQELGFRYVRFHAILSDEMGTLLREENQLLYLFFNADQIVDFLL